MMPQIEWTLLTRYVAGECSQAESAEVERWLATDAAHREQLVAARRVWDQAGALPRPERIEEMWQDLREEMHEREGTARRASAPRWRAMARIAAMIVLVAGAGFMWRVVSTGRAAREFVTAPGQRATVRLADGSRVELGVASTLRLRLGDDGPREVDLVGEAVFDVVHDARRPFRVYSGGAVTEDLGTRFGVRAYPGDRAVQVVVASGQVLLRGAQSAVLGARDLGRLDAAGRVTVVSAVDPEAYLGWTTGRIVFRDATLREVTTQLSRWYDVSVELPDALASLRITLDMPSPALADVLNAITVPLGLRYTRSDHRVILSREVVRS